MALAPETLPKSVTKRSTSTDGFCQLSGSRNRLRRPGVSKFGCTNACANARKSPRYQLSSSWQTRRTRLSGRPEALQTVRYLSFKATQSTLSLSRTMTNRSPRILHSFNLRGTLLSRSLFPSCGTHKKWVFSCNPGKSRGKSPSSKTFMESSFTKKISRPCINSPLQTDLVSRGSPASRPLQTLRVDFLTHWHV